MSTEDYPPTVAERRINEAAHNQARMLNLSHLGLTAVPDSIGQLTSLTELNIAGNPQLSSPPRSAPC